jgi:hypothetical protein
MRNGSNPARNHKTEAAQRALPEKTAAKPKILAVLARIHARIRAFRQIAPVSRSKRPAQTVFQAGFATNHLKIFHDREVKTFNHFSSKKEVFPHERQRTQNLSEAGALP